MKLAGMNHLESERIFHGLKVPFVNSEYRRWRTIIWMRELIFFLRGRFCEQVCDLRKSGGVRLGEENGAKAKDASSCWRRVISMRCTLLRAAS